MPRLTQCLNLGRGMHAAIGDNFLDHSQPGLEALNLGGILGGLLGSLTGDELTHLLLMQEPALECAYGNSAKDRERNDDHEKDEK
jgi:hypothetical protein